MIDTPRTLTINSSYGTVLVLPISSVFSPKVSELPLLKLLPLVIVSVKVSTLLICSQRVTDIVPLGVLMVFSALCSVKALVVTLMNCFMTTSMPAVCLLENTGKYDGRFCCLTKNFSTKALGHNAPPESSYKEIETGIKIPLGKPEKTKYQVIFCEKTF